MSLNRRRDICRVIIDGAERSPFDQETPLFTEHIIVMLMLFSTIEKSFLISQEYILTPTKDHSDQFIFSTLPLIIV